MFCWRITKYDPQYRTSNGFYTKNEWTCYSEIGKVFAGKQLTYHEYIKIENAYIQVVMLFMDCLAIDSLKITHLEQHGMRLKKIPFDTDKEIINEEYVNKEFIPSIMRLVLRNELWCKLEASTMYVHFGWDYYMYIGSAKPCKSTIQTIKDIGLFAEHYESPYHDEED